MGAFSIENQSFYFLKSITVHRMLTKREEELQYDVGGGQNSSATTSINKSILDCKVTLLGKEARLNNTPVTVVVARDDWGKDSGKESIESKALGSKSSQDRESIRSEVSEEKEHMDNELIYT